MHLVLLTDFLIPTFIWTLAILKLYIIVILGDGRNNKTPNRLFYVVANHTLVTVKVVLLFVVTTLKLTVKLLSAHASNLSKQAQRSFAFEKYIFVLF